MKTIKPLSASETLEILSRPYIKYSDIKKLACCGNKQANNLKETMINNLKEKNYYFPNGLIPTEEVIEVLKLNINHLKRCLDIERRLKND